MSAKIILIISVFALLAQFKEEKHHSHHRHRGRRDSLAIPIVVGIIGLATEAIRGMPLQYIAHHLSGCQWVGDSPFCYQHCDADHTQYRTGRQFIEGEAGYDAYCFLSFGVFQKKYCCRRNEQDRTWAGTCQSAMTGKLFGCDFFAGTTYVDKTEIQYNCGFLKCVARTFGSDPEEAQITTSRCNQLRLYDMNGEAVNGMITWRDHRNVPVHYWFKK